MTDAQAIVLFWPHGNEAFRRMVIDAMVRWHNRGRRA